VVVADNGLARDTVRELQSAGARIVGMGRNLGFGAAINRAVRETEGDVLALVNDDATPVVGVDFVSALTAPLRDGADMVAGVLLQEERPDLIETAGVEIDALLGPHDYLQNERIDRLEQPLPSPLGPCGGAAAYRRSAFDEAEGFDEGLFAYGEDVDLAIRLRAIGARCALATGARATHTGSGTLGYDSLEKARLVGRSRGYLLRKYRVLSRPAPAVAAVSIETAASLALALRHRSLAPALARVQGWRSCSVRVELRLESVATIPVAAGLRRRYARSRRGTSRSDRR
jgi:N-acetylglucosaminyl-diphospho-decaprenol L-rhamnosyltransferase